MRARVVVAESIVAVAPVVRDFDVALRHRIELTSCLLLYYSDRRHVSHCLVLAQGVSEFGAQSTQVLYLYLIK